MFKINKLTILDFQQVNVSWDKATSVSALMQRK